MTICPNLYIMSTGKRRERAAGHSAKGKGHVCLLSLLTPTILFPILVIFCLFGFFSYYYLAASPRRGTLEWIYMTEAPPLSFPHRRYAMGRNDRLVMLCLLAVYAFIAFWGLGDTEAPQSFYHFEAAEDSVLIDLPEDTVISEILYYTGLWPGSYVLEFSGDGETWSGRTEAAQSYADLFKWLSAPLEETQAGVRFIRITAENGPMELGELALYDDGGSLITPLFLRGSGIGRELFDEQALIPETPTYLNSAYFDEIYHARTAYEHIRNIYPYEISHPPLGKLIIAAGIQLFGMTPFGWRFMGTLFGVLMLAVLYVLLHNLFGKRVISVCGTVLFALDFMHYVQTRIATIDTYSVFFILLMYLFMYRYITLAYDTPFRKTLPPLLLCGLSFGLGAAAKWTSIYAGAGLAVLYAIALLLRGRHAARNGGGFGRFLVKTLAVSVLFFILIPCGIYYLSYIPYGLANGLTFPSLLWDKGYLDTVLKNQRYMLSYHAGVTSEHSYSSRWYQWIFNIRPILYYRSYLSGTVKSAFAAFNNPIVCWGGLMALASLFVSLWKRRDGRALFIVVGYFSQLAPWFFIGRTTFAYHYFPSTVFLVLSLAYVLNHIWERAYGRYRRAVYGFTAAAAVLFVLFYPVLSGAAAPTWYTTNLLRWFPSWPV